MELVVREMYENFLIMEACSRYYSLGTEANSDAQDVLMFINYSDHATLCKKGAKICCDFLKNKKFLLLVTEFVKLELFENVNTLRLKYMEIKQ